MAFSIKKQANLNFKKNTTFKIPRTAASFLPSSLGGLALWLKADAGVATFQSTYVSQIILTCTGGFSSYSGTYIATSTPDVDGVYSLFSSSNSKTIIKDGDFFFEGYFILASSGNGINWSFQNVLVGGLTISGATGSYTDANGVYLLNERNQSSGDIYRNNENGYYGLVNTNGAVNIYSPDFVLIYSNSSFGSGAWTNHGGGDFPEATGTVTATSIQLDPSGTVSGSVTTSDYVTSNVTAWADQSENGNNANVENSGEEPTFVSSFSNSKPAIQFDGETQLLLVADSSSLDFLNTSIFIVLKRIGNGIGNEITFMKNGDALEDAGSYWQVARLDGENMQFSVDNGGGYDRNSVVDISDGIARITDFTFDGTDFNIYVNGVQTATYNEPEGDINITNGSLQIGGYNKSFNNGGGELFNGQIAEIIMYNRAVTTPERQQVEAYLNSKYQIY